MENEQKFHEALQKLIHTAPEESIYDFMEKNTAAFFSTPGIAAYYQVLKHVDISASKRSMPKLIKAWLAFLSGDNAGLYSIMKYIDEAALSGVHESAFFYSLKAFAVISDDYAERLKYAKLAVDILPEKDAGLFMANAKLTYGQLLAGADRYRQAAEQFSAAHRIFYDMDLHFLAMIALVNELLNRYRLGEIPAVIDACSRALTMASSYKEETQDYWNIVHLPLGICYYEMNKCNLAIRHLKLAKASIDHMKLFHMHGLVELYLFKAYYLVKDAVGMEEIVKDTEAKFGHMNYIMTDLIVSMLRLMSAEPEGSQLIQSDIELFEVEYMKNRENTQDIVVEVLAFLKLRGLSDLITTEPLVKKLEKLRFTGMVPTQQQFLIYLAELHYRENRQKEALECLKEAAQLFRDYGICAAFCILPLRSLNLLEKVDRQLYRMLAGDIVGNAAAQPGALLSAREKEIMQLIAKGKNNEEISKALFIGIGTIKWHINHIFSKLEVKNRVQAIEKAKSLGEIS